MTQEEIESLKKQILSYVFQPSFTGSLFDFFLAYLAEKDLLDDLQAFADRLTNCEGNQ